MTSPLIKDYEWVRQSFMVKADMLEKVDRQNRFFSTSSLKFTDTTPGGNYAINPPPQFTPSADVPVDKFFSTGNPMGRYYGEAIDDNGQIIHMRFGVAQFNSLTTFFTGFYNTDAGRLARTGRASGMFYNLGKAAGYVVSIVAWPLWLINMVVNVGGTAARFALGKPASKFYYLKPTMGLYWNAVTTIVNHICVNKGIVPRALEDETAGKRANIGLSKADRAKYHELLPDIFSEGGSVDVYRLANRAQRLAYRHNKKLNQALENSSGSLKSIGKTISELFTGTIEDKPGSLENYISRWVASQQGQLQSTGSDGTAKDSIEQLEPYKEGEVKDDGWAEFADAELNDGSQFVSFRVNYTGQVQESFSNSVGDSEIAQKMNGMASSARNTSFSLAGGNISEAIGAVADGMKSFLSGVADSFGASGLVGLAGSAFVDIPKHWQNSTASLPRSTYTIHLQSPFGNPISQLINMDIQLAMLLAAALPISTGKQSYTSPFLVEYYDKGKAQSRLAMIDSLSVSRGTGNLGFTKDGKCLAMEVTFSLVDMSSIMHMPIAEGFSVNPEKAFFDEDTVFSDYMATLAGMSLADQIYVLPKLKLNLTRQMAHWDSFFSASHFMNFMGNTLPARLFSAGYKGIER